MSNFNINPESFYQNFEEDLYDRDEDVTEDLFCDYCGKVMPCNDPECDVERMRIKAEMSMAKLRPVSMEVKFLKK